MHTNLYATINLNSVNWSYFYRNILWWVVTFILRKRSIRFIRFPIQFFLHPRRIFLNLYLDSTLLDENSIPIVFLPPHPPSYTTSYIFPYLLSYFSISVFLSSFLSFFLSSFLSYILIVYLQTPSTSSLSSFILWNNVTLNVYLISLIKSTTIAGLVLLRYIYYCIHTTLNITSTFFNLKITNHVLLLMTGDDDDTINAVSPDRQGVRISTGLGITIEP